MKKSTIIILAILIILVLWGYSSRQPNLKGFYQVEMNGYHVQMLFREEDNSFVEWIDNREVDRGTFTKMDTNIYKIKSNLQQFEIALNKDNSFRIIVKKLNDGNSFIMKNISTDDYRLSFGEWDDVDEFKALLY